MHPNSITISRFPHRMLGARAWRCRALIALSMLVAPAQAQVLSGGMVAGSFNGSGSASTYEVTIRVVTDPGVTPYFWANQFWVDTAIDHGGYFGLQTNGVVGDGTLARLMIFSIWNAVEAQAAPGAVAVNFGGEGVGWSLRRAHPWRTGAPYTFHLERHDNVWWRVSISAPGEPLLHLGSIRVTVGAPLRPSFVTFSEYYLDTPTCEDVPYAHVVFENAKYGNAATVSTTPWTYGNCLSNAQGYRTAPNAHAHRTGIARARASQANFNGDRRSDLLWHNISTFASTIWQSADNTAQQLVTTVTNAFWTIAGVGDFNGDDHSDILWHNTSTLANVIWLSANSSTQQPVATVSNAAWTIAGIGDFDGDGRSDILWRNTSTLANVIWRSGNLATQQPVTTIRNAAWSIAGIGDFNGDGRSDILWHNTATLANVIWFSANYGTQQAVTTIRNADWGIAGIGDFDGDGRSDILWHNAATLANSIWKSGNYATQQYVTTVTNPAWKVAGVADFDGDGRVDIFWRNATTGANAIWRSGNYATQQSVAPVPVGWRTHF